MRVLRFLGMAMGALAVVILAAGAAYLAYVLRLWGSAVRSTDPFDATEPI